jgi:glutaredoxin
MTTTDTKAFDPTWIKNLKEAYYTYVDNDARYCPFCHETKNIEWGTSPEYNTGELDVHHNCLNCGNSWMETYLLACFTPKLNPKDPKEKWIWGWPRDWLPDNWPYPIKTKHLQERETNKEKP